MPVQKKEKKASQNRFINLTRRLKFLSTREIYLIDDLLESVGDYGEVRLTVKSGSLRFAARMTSLDAMKWEGIDLE